MLLAIHRVVNDEACAALRSGIPGGRHCRDLHEDTAPLVHPDLYSVAVGQDALDFVQAVLGPLWDAFGSF